MTLQVSERRVEAREIRKQTHARMPLKAQPKVESYFANLKVMKRREEEE